MPRFGPWGLLGPLGQSARAEVLRARWDALVEAAPAGAVGVEVALKRTLPHLAGDAQARASLRHEAGLLAHLGGWPAPALVAVDADATMAPLPSLARAFVPGLTLAELAKLAEPPVRAEAGADGSVSVAAAHAALAALAALHARGVVCGDVAPGNVVVGGGRATLVDLGNGAIAGTDAAGAARAGVATPAFAAPEVAAGARADRAADVFAAASLVAWLLAGAGPFADVDAAGHWRRVRAAADADVDAFFARHRGASWHDDALERALRSAWRREPAGRPGLDALVAALPPPTPEAAAALAAVTAAASPSTWPAPPAAAEDRGERVTGRDDADATVLVDGDDAAALLRRLISER